MYTKISRTTAIVAVAALCFSGAAALGLTAKPNVAPVVATPIAAYTQYNGTTRSIDLPASFRDPDASAAVRVNTSLGAMNFTLDGETAPITVANFLRYVDEGRYFMPDPTTGKLVSLFFHRSVPGFVIQSGGFLGTVNPQAPSDNPGQVLPTQVASFGTIQNEPFISNTRGTIAMAKVGGDANSATSQWFINLNNNSANLDGQNGGFTVFGRVAGGGMMVADAIALLPRYNGGGTFAELPVRNYSGNKIPRVENLVSIPEFVRTAPLTFSATSSDTNIADVRLSEGRLLVTAKQNGTAQITVTATDLDGAAVSQNFSVNVVAAPGRLLNIATRVDVRTGGEVLIGGFIVRGGSSKRLLVRAIGPSLVDAGVANVLNDPYLELRDQNGALVAENDNWQDAPNKRQIIDTGIAPSAPAEAAILTTLPSSAENTSYTAIMRGPNEKTGIGVVEVYDLDSGPGSKILNISTRGCVGVGEDVMIGGFILGGSETKRMVVRAIGPSLANAGIAGALSDPMLELRDSQGTLLEENDNWQTHPQASEIQSSGLAPTNAKEAALLRPLGAGAYTAIIRGGGDTPTGVALVEVYQLP
jgi:cyclophilin family peptidyl-prolyl cis-trans isomerase